MIAGAAFVLISVPVVSAVIVENLGVQTGTIQNLIVKKICRLV